MLLARPLSRSNTTCPDGLSTPLLRSLERQRIWFTQTSQSTREEAVVINT
ncbi:hypothetical protein [Tahibacter amnicola]|uniref:Uncharacterized protein n=1 Tax=Tahibacter amnicola TaxID=2976241 RepID=A0ABY6BN30_9GAMM|nr:hypothetical protein [Tahibacter amnicola]UXI69790.1 hypothetical protein N4264_09215 [Tahibacter amnicola]